MCVLGALRCIASGVNVDLDSTRAQFGYTAGFDVGKVPSPDPESHREVT